ncbi:hypothetical protein K469DRAFT_314048 [Zopfia rhizophila CBS 207.26]|uniref:Uncharacterized protein n=1 Tax=Zopfia rhizophila CBS 207.26 TaxID=1314779 RepID=A0A6A6EPE0_9PEZI|nr:hypothetical protein K469DRAFT_314048 [Zopfia rhizophila CBS 207.26]
MHHAFRRFPTQNRARPATPGSLRLIPLIFSIFFYRQLVYAAGKTSIFIDQVPAYAELPECAEGPLSTIVRAMSSGCGDNNALTSFNCFCMESNSQMSSVISTAVRTTCSRSNPRSSQTRGPPPSIATIAPFTIPEIRSALDVFHSYCLRSTELSSYSTLPPTATITRPPQRLRASMRWVWEVVEGVRKDWHRGRLRLFYIRSSGRIGPEVNDFIHFLKVEVEDAV